MTRPLYDPVTDTSPPAHRLMFALQNALFYVANGRGEDALRTCCGEFVRAQALRPSAEDVSDLLGALAQAADLLEENDDPEALEVLLACRRARQPTVDAILSEARAREARA